MSKPIALSAAAQYRNGEQPGNQRSEHPLQLPGQGEQALYLVAAMLSLDTPLAKVLAVVAEHAVIVLAHPGSCAADHFRVTEANQFVGSHPYTASAHEVRERNLRHRSPEEVMPKGAVVNDSAAADVDAVMGEREARSDKVRTQRGFLVTRQKSVVLPQFVRKDRHDMFIQEHVIRNRVVLAAWRRAAATNAGNIQVCLLTELCVG